MKEMALGEKGELNSGLTCRNNRRTAWISRVGGKICCSELVPETCQRGWSVSWAMGKGKAVLLLLIPLTNSSGLCRAGEPRGTPAMSTPAIANVGDAQRGIPALSSHWNPQQGQPFPAGRKQVSSMAVAGSRGAFIAAFPLGGWCTGINPSTVCSHLGRAGLPTITEPSMELQLSMMDHRSNPRVSPPRRNHTSPLL